MLRLLPSDASSSESGSDWKSMGAAAAAAVAPGRRSGCSAAADSPRQEPLPPMHWHLWNVCLTRNPGDLRAGVRHWHSFHDHDCSGLGNRDRNSIPGHWRTSSPYGASVPESSIQNPLRVLPLSQAVDSMIEVQALRLPVNRRRDLKRS